ncbi:hypothetical protein MRX96_033123 [Rhipicephalus microplus]
MFLEKLILRKRKDTHNLSKKERPEKALLPLLERWVTTKGAGRTAVQRPCTVNEVPASNESSPKRPP